jgi:hypothetical protein
VRPAPGEHHPTWRVDLHELADRLDAVSHQDAVAAAGHRFQRLAGYAASGSPQPFFPAAA